jgi:hypothetical protein
MMMTSLYEHAECDEVAENMDIYPVTFDEALALVRVRMPDESSTIMSNTAEALLGRVPLRVRQIACAKRLSHDDIRRHAWVATANGPFDPNDDSFTTACELVRREWSLPPLHSADD